MTDGRRHSGSSSSDRSSSADTSAEMLSLMVDDVRPLMLLRRRGSEIFVEAATDERTLGVAAGRELMCDALRRLGLGDGASDIVDAARAALTTCDVVRLDLGDAALDVLSVATLRFVPIGTDGSGAADLILVLGDATSSARDPLTNLAGRDLLRDRWAVATARARRRGGHLSVVFVDLDGFKSVNDRHGHGAGDAVLREISARLLAVVRAHDTVARYGGDEFVVLVDGDRPVGDAVARRIVEVAGEPVAIDGQLGPALARVGASVGVAECDVCAPGQDSLEAAIALADAQMYKAKAGGGARLVSA